MLEGLYKFEIGIDAGEQTGVAVLRAGRVEGGNNSMYFYGAYLLQDGALSIEAIAAPHGDATLLGSTDKVPISLTGKFDRAEDRSLLRGQASGREFDVVLSKLAQLAA